MYDNLDYYSTCMHPYNIILCVSYVPCDEYYTTVTTVTALTSNFDGDVCPGDQLVLTCLGQGTALRWSVVNEGGLTLEHTFARGHQLGTQHIQTQDNAAGYNLTLVSTDYHHFESTLSTISTSTLQNIRVECITSDSSQDGITLEIIGILSFDCSLHTANLLPIRSVHDLCCA